MKLTQKNQRAAGWTLVEVLVIVAVFVVLAAIILPVITAGQASRYWRINCVNNLRQIQLAMKTWEVDHGDGSLLRTPMTNGVAMGISTNSLTYAHFQTLSNILEWPKLLLCPSDTAKTAAPSFNTGDFSNTNVSYFINVAVSDVYPQMFLLGDRNLTLDDLPVKPGFVSLTTNSVAGWTEELHRHQGNIGLADGSVQQYSDYHFRLELEHTEPVTNRLAVP